MENTTDTLFQDFSIEHVSSCLKCIYTKSPRKNFFKFAEKILHMYLVKNHQTYS